MIEKVQNNEPFAFTRWGDFEWDIVMNNKGKVSCDNCNVIEEQSIAMNEILDSKPEYVLGLQGLAYGLYPEYIDSRIDKSTRIPADIIHNQSVEHGIEDMLDILSEKDTIFVGPEYMRVLDIYEHFVEIPVTDAWYDIDRIFNDICEIIDKGGFYHIVYVAGSVTNILVDRLYHKYGNTHIHIDVGSAFDPYVGKHTRVYHKTLNLNSKYARKYT